MLAAMDENEGAIAERQLKRGMTLAVGSSFALGASICMLVRDVGESRLDGCAALGRNPAHVYFRLLSRRLDNPDGCETLTHPFSADRSSLFPIPYSLLLAHEHPAIYIQHVPRNVRGRI
jgi:hypothetical protein